MTPEERRKHIMYDLDEYHKEQLRNYHDREGRDADNPTFLPIAALIALGYVLAVMAFAWVMS